MLVAAYIYSTGGMYRAVWCQDKSEAVSICVYLAATMGRALSEEQKDQIRTDDIIEFDNGACVQINELEEFEDVNKESLRDYEAALGQLSEALRAMPSVSQAEIFLTTRDGASLAFNAGLRHYTPEIIIKMFPTATAKT